MWFLPVRGIVSVSDLAGWSGRGLAGVSESRDPDRVVVVPWWWCHGPASWAWLRPLQIQSLESSFLMFNWMQSLIQTTVLYMPYNYSLSWMYVVLLLKTFIKNVRSVMDVTWVLLSINPSCDTMLDHTAINVLHMFVVTLPSSSPSSLSPWPGSLVTGVTWPAVWCVWHRSTSTSCRVLTLWRECVSVPVVTAQHSQSSTSPRPVCAAPP